MERIARARGAGCLRSVALQLGLVVLVFSAAGVCAVAAAAVPLPRGWQQYREFLFPLGLAALMLTLVAGTALWGGVTLYQRARRLDAAFQPLGLAGRAYLLNGRQYHGELAGRPVHVYFYRGPTLELYLDTRLRTRLGAAPRSGLGQAVSQIAGRPLFEIADPALAGLSFTAAEPDWARRALAEPAAAASLGRLLAPATAVELRTCALEPGAAHFSLRFVRVDALTPEAVRGWLNDLLIMTQTWESAPPPAQTLEPSRLELTTRARRGALVWPVVGVALACGAAVIACVLTLLVLTDTH